MECDWVFGNVVCIYCHCFVLFSRRSGRRWSICLESLSPTSVTSSRSFLSESVLEYLGLDCCLDHCVRAFCLYLYMSILHCCPLPGRAMHSSDCHHGNELRQCQQRFISVESSLWPQVVCRLFSKIFRCWLIVSAVMIATCVRAFLLED